MSNSIPPVLTPLGWVESTRTFLKEHSIYRPQDHADYPKEKGDKYSLLNRCIYASIHASLDLIEDIDKRACKVAKKVISIGEPAAYIVRGIGFTAQAIVSLTISSLLFTVAVTITSLIIIGALLFAGIAVSIALAGGSIALTALLALSILSVLWTLAVKTYEAAKEQIDSFPEAPNIAEIFHDFVKKRRSVDLENDRAPKAHRRQEAVIV